MCSRSKSPFVSIRDQWQPKSICEHHPGLVRWVFLLVLALLSFTLAAEETSAIRILRVAADPNNLPFSNDKCEGFENKLADLIARELHARVEYSWRAQRRGFFRETLKEDIADVVLGVPTGFERALTTKPYYRSAYVFVSRKDRGLSINSFDDPSLRTLRVGVQLIGDDGANTPPAHALAKRGIITNVVGFTLYGDYTEPNPPARIIDAVANGDIDVAIAWGPLAGYFSKLQQGKLLVTPIAAQADSAVLPLAFDISVGVRRRDKQLRDEIDAILIRRREEIQEILDEYGIPCFPLLRSTALSGGISE